MDQQLADEINKYAFEIHERATIGKNTSSFIIYDIMRLIIKRIYDAPSKDEFETCLGDKIYWLVIGSNEAEMGKLVHFYYSKEQQNTQYLILNNLTSDAY